MRVSAFLAGGLLAAWCGAAALGAAAPGRAPVPEARPAAKGQPGSKARPAARRTPARAAAAARRPPAAPAPVLPPGAAEFFEREVRPVLVEQCTACHGEKVRQGGLRLDLIAGALKGGEKGPAVVPGHPEKSLLVRAVRHEKGLEMPPGRKLPEKQVAALEKWVRLGAPWPGAAGSQAAARPQTWEEALRARKQWWSLAPVRRPAVPAVRNAASLPDGHPVDRFLLSSLEKRGLKLAPPADRRTLARRVHLLLTGLPPGPEEVEAFVSDRSPDAYEKLVDRALASPHYGERWARHWLDVVRFGETHGYEWNYEVRDAWRYRDYLIRAFNQDVPYDRLVREHLAGDLLPDPRWNREEGINESVIGTAFYRFGENGHDVFKEIGLDVLDNQIDTVSKAFQATTVSCARCHDHKLDAVSTKDYYALLGILVSSRQVVQTLDAPDANEARKRRLRELKAEIRRELAPLWTRDAGEAGRYLRAAWAAREKQPDAGELAKGLDPKRLEAWGKALEKKPAALEDPLYPWAETASAGDPASAWRRLRERYERERRERSDWNRERYTLFGDFRSGRPEGWRVDGLGLRDGASPSGEFAVAGEGEQVVSGVFPAGMFTHTLSERLNGSIQSPWMPTDRKFVSFQALGGRNGVARAIPDHRQLTDAGQELKPALGWVTVPRSERDEWVYLELVTRLHNPRYTGDEKDQRSFFGVTRAVLHDENAPPKEDLGWLARLFDGAGPASADEAAARYSAALRRAFDAWAAGMAGDDDARWIDWLLRLGLLTNSPAATPRLAELVERYRAEEKELAAPRLVAGMADQDAGFDVPVYLRGDFRTPGDVVPRRYLEALSGSAERASGGSGRRDLAERIADPRNPLTARVMVNRVWHWLFGAGLVRTTDDFGHLGEKPSHPELLDYLASRFVEEGWSLKRLVRSLVLTRAFRMSGRADARARELDPENRLLHHFPARRLEAEAIRDSILAVSGRLDRTLYGPSIQPYRDDPKPERRLFPGPLDGNGRRSLYTKITLMGGPRFLEVFNFPDPKAAQGRRDVTNVPAQALALLNDPFVVGQAEFWAERLAAGSEGTPPLRGHPPAGTRVPVAERLEGMFLAVLGRRPQPQERIRFDSLVRELAALYEVLPGEELKSRAVWKDVAHALFNLKEFIYVP